MSLYVEIAVVFLLAATSGCDGGGGSQDVGPAQVNDAAPTGTIVAQGTFSGLNTQGASGTAAIYRAEDVSYWLRLESLSAPEEPAMLVTVTAGGEEVFRGALKSSIGNHTYSLGNLTATTWNSVGLRSSQTPPPKDEYAIAVLQNQGNASSF